MSSFLSRIYRLLCIVCIFVITGATLREISYEINPGCGTLCEPSKDNKTSLNLVHVRATGKNDTIHYLWSTYKLPTVIISKTNLGAKLKVDWKELLHLGKSAISFSEVPTYSVALVFKEIWQFYDENDLAKLETGSNITSLSMSDLFWSYMKVTSNDTTNFITVFPHSWNSDALFSQKGRISLQFSASADQSQSDEYPHLWYTSESSQLKLFMSGLNTFNKKNRFAAEVVAISSFLGNSIDETHWSPDPIISINDEYSPGVFKTNQLLSSCSTGKKDCEGFVVWKPVAYIGEIPTVANSSDATSSDFLNNFEVSDSIIMSYFNKNFSSVSWNITFGSSGDGFYSKTKHTSWSVMVGMGQPVMEKMSILAIVVTAVGLGTPFLIMLFGVSFLGYKKWKQKSDDPLLEG